MTEFELMLTQMDRGTVIDYVEPDYYPEGYCVNEGYITIRPENLDTDLKLIFDPLGNLRTSEAVAR